MTICSWQDYCQDVSIEKAGWYLEPYDENELESLSRDISRDLHSTSLVPSTVSISRFREIETSNADNRHAAWYASQQSYEVIVSCSSFVITACAHHVYI